MSTLTDQDYVAAAGVLGCDVAAVRAVVTVESNGSGFLPDGRPKILFEAHLFSKFTNHKYDKTNPNISSPTWNKSLYKGGAAEWDRLEEARALNEEAALKSASWGLFQIMGFNYQTAGFASVQEYVAAMKESEGAQLMAFVNFVKSQKLDVHLRAKNWAGFAARYNGPNYRENQYDTRLANAYRKFGGN